MSKRSSAGSQDLDEGVGEFDLVGILFSVAVDALHANTLGSTVDTTLGSVDVVVEAVESTDGDLGRDALGDDEHVLLLVDLAGTHRVVVQGTHSPAEWSALHAEFCVKLLLSLSYQLLVAKLPALGLDNGLLTIGGRNGIVGIFLGRVGVGKRWRTGLDIGKIVVLNNSVVGNNDLAVDRDGALEEERALDELPGPEGVVPVDDLAVDVGDEEEGGEEADTTAGAHGDRRDVPGGLLVQAKLRGPLVDDGEGADGAGDEEEEGGGEDGDLGRVFAHVDDHLDEHEDGCTEASSNGGSHSKTGEDGTETLATVPPPLDVAGSHGCDTDTSNRRDQGVGRRNVSRVACAPHDPDGSTCEGASESQHLDRGVVLEALVGDDAVLDGLCCSCTDGDGSHHFEYGAEDHGLAVGDGTGGHAGGPGVGDIVGTVVVGIEQGKEGADGEDVRVFGEHHDGGCSLSRMEKKLKERRRQATECRAAKDGAGA